MALQKNVKSRVFWILKKCKKKRILELWLQQLNVVGDLCTLVLKRKADIWSISYVISIHQ